MRVYPALRITFFEAPDEEQIDFLLAQLDDFRPTAINDIDNGVIAYFGSADARERALAMLGSYELVDVMVEDVPDENWAERSQAALTPVTVGSLTIAPPWSVTDELRASAPGPIIVILPSMGFGTGHHASTRLCLELLQRVSLQGKRVLDVGTGSGVLAIAARVLGAADVVGIDVDPDAITNARENLELNAVSDGVTFVESDLATEAKRGMHCDVALANLTGSLLQRQASSLFNLGEAGSVLIVSGFQTHERHEVQAAMTVAGWTLGETMESETWMAAEFRRTS